MSLAETIAHALGNGKEQKNGDGWLTCCPVHGDEKPSLSIRDSTDSSGNPDITVHCHTGCDFRAVKDEIRGGGLLPEWETNDRRRPLNGSKITAGGGKKDNLPAFIWSRSKRDQEAAEVIRKAFAFRCINLEEIPPNMRLNEYKGQHSIACVMQSPLDEKPPAKPQCVHLTLLNDEGRKCGTRYQGEKKGLAVLFCNEENRLIIGEGLETTLSATQATGYSGMVCGDAGNMAGMAKLPERFREIFILVDSDPGLAGQKAALTAAENIGQANTGAAVFLVIPDASCFTDQPVKKDFNDLSTEAIQERFKAAEKVDGAVLERQGGAVGYVQTREEEKQEQPDSPLPLTKKNEQSEPFPFDVLGDTMAAACRDIQRAVQAPDALIAQSVLASANLAVQPLRDVMIDGRVFPPSLFLLTIAATGERKSAVDQVVLKPHREVEYQAEQDMNSLNNVYEMEQAAWEQEKNALIKDKKKTSQEKRPALEQLEQRKPEKPLDQRRLVSDFTFEGLYKLFQAGVPSKGLFADEGGQVTGGHGMRQETILSTATGLSKFWDGAPVDRIRVIDGASSLHGRRLAVHLMMQEKVGLDFFNNETLRDQGLGSRMLAVWPTSTVGRRKYSAVNAHEKEGVRRFYQQVSGLLAQSMPFKEGRNEQELDPPLMGLSPEAKKLWEDFYNQVEAASGPKQDLATIRGFANKAAEHAARIAGTVQLFKDPAAVEIQAEAMNCGIRAMEWYLDEALRISGSSNPAQHLVQAKEVLRWIHDRGQKVVALPDIYQYGPVRSAGAARKVVETLKAHNHLLDPKVPAGEKKFSVTCRNGKQSREWWEVHPESNKSFLEE